MKGRFGLIQMACGIYLLGIMGSIEWAQSSEEVISLILYGLFGVSVMIGSLYWESAYKSPMKRKIKRMATTCTGTYCKNQYDGARHVEEKNISRAAS